MSWKFEQGKEGKAAAAQNNNNKAKIVIFSHEALSLHKLVKF
jgi:hypothetical protein